jgi:glutamate/aspartate transport system substrate-binding protein
MSRTFPARSRTAAFAALLCLAASALALAPAAPAAAPPPTLAKVRDTGVVTLAYREASIPFSYLDGNKRPVGYAMDLCMRVVDALRRDLKMPLRVELLSVTPATRIAAIRDGKADLECGSTTNNATRRKDVAFTVTHYFAGAKLLVRADSGIQRLADLRGKTVVSTRGTSPLAALRAAEEKGIIGGARILEAKDHDEAFAIVERGEAQAFAMDDILLYSLRATSKEPKKWAVVGEFITVEPLAIMLRRGDPEFKRYVDTVLSRAMLDGDVRTLYDRWFMAPIPPRGVNLGIPLSPLMRDQLNFPTDKVGDQLGG